MKRRRRRRRRRRRHRRRRPRSSRCSRRGCRPANTSEVMACALSKALRSRRFYPASTLFITFQ